MAKTSARIAAQKAEAVSPTKIATPKKKQAQKVKGGPNAIKKPAKVSGAKKDVARVTAGRGGRKRKPQKQSEATKALKRKLAAKAKRSDAPVASSEAPAPVEVFNDELGTTGLEWEMETIVDSRKEDDGSISYLVEWKGYPASANTWEPEVHLRNATDFISKFDDKNPERP